jgi:GTP-binding protein
MKKVVILGRLNVGKSTLFNRLSTTVKTITLDYEGVTRDFVKDIVEWNNVKFELIDSGGLNLKKTQDIILGKVRDIGLQLVQEADVIVFVCDGTTGILQEDQEIARVLHKSGKKVILVINKTDNKLTQEHEHEFKKLGFEHNVPLSATHSIGIGDLLDVIVHEIKNDETPAQEEDDAMYKVALLGKPNAGKSSLLNILVQKERAIVTDIPGTTREPLSEKIKFYKKTIQITDTAGIRRQRAVTQRIEELMVKSAFDAVKDADIILLLMDASQGTIYDQELKLAFYVFDQGKAFILLFNKYDLLTPELKKDFEYSLEPYEFMLKKVETLYISCLTDKNLGKLLPMIDEVWQKHSRTFNNLELTQLFRESLAKKPLFHKGLPLIVFNAEQVKAAPINILLKVNEPKWFTDSQRGFFENVLRAKYDLKGAPVQFVVRKRAK